MNPDELWEFLPRGYLFTILIEIPVLLLGLAPLHPWRRRLGSGFWLTACTYPVVVLVIPMLIDPVGDRLAFCLVAETFAPIAECTLFGVAFHLGKALPAALRWRDYAAITIANLASFGIGEFVRA